MSCSGWKVVWPDKPIFNKTKKNIERRATFRNVKELQDFINEQIDEIN